MRTPRGDDHGPTNAPPSSTTSLQRYERAADSVRMEGRFMTVAPWDALTTLGRAIRAADWFDEQERNYKLAIAPKIQSALEVAHDGEWWAPLDAVFKSKSYNLTNFRLGRHALGRSA